MILILISFMKGGSLPCVGLTELPKCPVCLERMVSRLDYFFSGFHVTSSPLKLSSSYYLLLKFGIFVWDK